jgi:hypothetical protein
MLLDIFTRAVDDCIELLKSKHQHLLLLFLNIIRFRHAYFIFVVLESDDLFVAIFIGLLTLSFRKYYALCSLGLLSSGVIPRSILGHQIFQADIFVRKKGRLSEVLFLLPFSDQIFILEFDGKRYFILFILDFD